MAAENDQVGDKRGETMCSVALDVCKAGQRPAQVLLRGADGSSAGGLSVRGPTLPLRGWMGHLSGGRCDLEKTQRQR